MRDTNRGRGQTATELIVVLAIALAVLGLFLLSGQERLGSAQASLQVRTAQSAADEIVKAADAVWLEGTGSKRSVAVALPGETTAVAISGSTLVVKVSVPGGITDVVSKAREPLFGSVSVAQKQQTIAVQATDTGVRIGAQALDASPKMAQAEVLATNDTQFLQRSFNVSNQGAADFGVSLTLSWTPGAVNATFADPADQSFTLTAGSSRQIYLNFTFAANALGSFAGAMQANATNGESDRVDVLANAYPVACAP